MMKKEKYAQEFAAASEKIRTAIVERYLDFYRHGIRNPEAFRRYILSKDITGEIMETLGLGELQMGFVAEKYPEIAASAVSGITTAPKPIIGMLQEIDTLAFQERVRDVGIALKENLIKAYISEGMTEEMMRERLMSATNMLSEAQVNALINTSLSTVSRATMAEVAKGMPADMRFRYIGPKDDRNREECRAVLDDPRNENGFTREEIEDLPVDFVFGGGWNCRHEWEMVVEE